MRWRLALACVGVAACVDVPHPLLRRVSPSVEHLRDREGEAAPPAPAVPLYAPMGEPGLGLRVVAEEGGRQFVLARGARLEVCGSAITAAEDAPDASLQEAARAEHGWLFVDASGGVYASTTFTGPLRHLNDVRSDGWSDGRIQADRRLARSHGRAVVDAGERGFHWSDGGALQRVPLDGVAEMAWHGRALGAAILRDGELRVTADGGLTWRRLDAGSATPLTLVGAERGLFVFTTEGWRRLDNAGVGVAPLESRPLPERSRTPAVDAAALARVLGRDLRQTPRPPRRWPEAPRLEDPPWWESPFHLRVTGAAAAARPMERPGFARSESRRAVIARRESRGAVALWWRGEDDRGVFEGRSAFTALPLLPANGGWSVVTITRTGALVRLPFDPARPGGALAWFGVHGMRRVPCDPAWRLAFAEGVALPGGGAVVVLVQYRRPPADGSHPSERVVDLPRVATVLRLAPDGAIERSRVVAEHRQTSGVLGIGERDGRWGVVMALDRSSRDLTLFTLDGDAVPFQRGEMTGPLVTCSAATPFPARLHVLATQARFATVRYAPASTGIIEEDPADGVHRVVFELYSGWPRSLCVRAVEGSVAQSTLMLRARGGVLTGALDDGLTVTPVRALVNPTLLDAAP